MNKNLLALIGFGLALLYPPTLSADTTIEIDGYGIMLFADSLFEDHELERAESEYLRYLYYFPDGELSAHAELQILRCRYLRGDRKGLLLRISKMNPDSSSREFRYEKGFLKVLGWLDLHEDKPFRLRAESIREGLRQIESLEDYPGKTSLVEFKAEWENAEFEKLKSPVLAGLFSTLLPGSGSIYAQRPREGAYSMILTLLLYASAIQAREENAESLSLFLASFGLVFHGGSVYAAVNSVHRYNDALRQNRFEELRKTHGVRLGIRFNR